MLIIIQYINGTSKNINMCWLVKARPDMNATKNKDVLVFEFSKYIARMMRRVWKKLCRAKLLH
jgi:hypothetical protein